MELAAKSNRAVAQLVAPALHQWRELRLRFAFGQRNDVPGGGLGHGRQIKRDIDYDARLCGGDALNASDALRDEISALGFTVIDTPEGTTLEQTTRIAQEMAAVLRTEPEVSDYQIYGGPSAPFNFNGLVRHYYVRQSPELGDLQLTLTAKSERDRTSHEVALDLRQRLKSLDVPTGTALKVVEPPPGPPVLCYRSRDA